VGNDRDLCEELPSSLQCFVGFRGIQMGSVIYDSAASVQQLLDRGFEIPIYFAALGTNGSVFAGTFLPSPDGHGLDCQITIQPDSDEGLTAPVNIMYVDRKGEAAMFVLRPSADESAPTRPVT
jgi:hypothetical protein